MMTLDKRILQRCADFADMRKRHQPIDHDRPETWCWDCSEQWPCDASLALDALEVACEALGAIKKTQVRMPHPVRDRAVKALEHIDTIGAGNDR